MLDQRIGSESKYQKYIDALNTSYIDPNLVSELYSELFTNTNEKFTILILQAYYEKEFKFNLSKSLTIFNQLLVECDKYLFPFHYLRSIQSIIEIKLIQGDILGLYIKLENVDRLITALKSKGVLDAELESLYEWSQLKWQSGYYKQALDKAEAGLRTIQFHPDAKRKLSWEIQFLYIRAIFNFHLGNYQESITNTLRSLTLVNDLDENLKRNWSVIFLNLQLLIYRTLGEFELSFEYVDILETKINSEKIKDRFLLSSIYSNIGMFQIEQANYLSAFNNLNQALEIHQQDETEGSIIQQAISLANIARILIISGDAVKARETYQASMRLYNQSNSEIEKVEKISWFIDQLISEGSLIKAQELIQKAERLANKHESKREQLLVLTRKAKWLKSTNKIAEARSIFLEVCREAEIINQNREMVQSAVYLSDLSLDQIAITGTDKTILDQALKNSENAIYLASKSGHSYYLIQAMRIKSSILGYIPSSISESLYILDDALSIADEKGLFQLQGELYKLKQQLEQKRNIFSSSKDQDSKQIVATQDLLSAIRLATGRIPKLLESDTSVKYQDISLYYLGVFIFNQAQLYIKFFDPLPQEFLTNHDFFDPMNMGLMFSTSLGQGTRYNQGLFGPLPTPDVKNFHSIVYLQQLETPNNSNPSGKYILLAVNYHSDYDPLFYNRHEFEKFFKRILKIDKSQLTITDDFVMEIKKSLNALVSREIDDLLSQLN